MISLNREVIGRNRKRFKERGEGGGKIPSAKIFTKSNLTPP
jgi:hypothetical protein